VVVFSLLKLLFLVGFTIVWAPLIVLTAVVVDADRAYRTAQAWCFVNMAVFGIRVRGRRLAPLDPRRPYVFMSNHRSHLDVFAVVAALRELQLRWVAKRELTRIPVFGWALRRSGHVIIDRSDQEKAIESLRAARLQMERGVSLVIFPEGTRSRDGVDLLPLKKGGFMVALETGAPIVPIVVRGSRPLLPKGEWRVRRGDVEVIVGEPIPVAGRSREELMARVREFMLGHLDAAMREPASVAAEAV
jgi:1-acyl-sn-glycerol-3-phosphate acyltransferase